MKTLLTITAIILLSSCGAMKEGIHSNYILYNKTQAFFVLEEVNPHKLIVENAQGTQKFRLYDYNQVFNVSDTILTIENQWVFGQIKFVR